MYIYIIIAFALLELWLSALGHLGASLLPVGTSRIFCADAPTILVALVILLWSAAELMSTRMMHVHNMTSVVHRRRMELESDEASIHGVFMEELIRYRRHADMLTLLRAGNDVNMTLSIHFLCWETSKLLRMTCLEYSVYQCDCAMSSLLFIYGADPIQNAFVWNTSRHNYNNPADANGTIADFPGLHAIVNMVENDILNGEKDLMTGEMTGTTLNSIDERTSAVDRMRQTLRMLEAALAVDVPVFLTLYIL